MRKILVLLPFLCIYQAQAANLTDTIGAECGKILFNINEYKYPKLFKVVNDRNKQFDYLEKCLELYQKTGGKIEILNKRYQRAYALYSLSTGSCIFGEENKKEQCMEAAEYIFNANLTLSSKDLYNKYSLIYNTTTHNEDSIEYEVIKKSFENTQTWMDEDKKELEKIFKQESERKKSWLDWF